ncbi:CLUMA_CG004457, isoform A [Clunio marinus]|uniref:CLUMA_CG004457, isoform A n=1 Tax=Clunio marinus TaxID=568069 RepID=A0A1J1HRW7_9DIPT|nr:CLUMA_CG004457, isoform A [Clunio marinus]
MSVRIDMREVELVCKLDIHRMNCSFYSKSHRKTFVVDTLDVIIKIEFVIKHKTKSLLKNSHQQLLTVMETVTERDVKMLIKEFHRKGSEQTID